jgi:hypothetical protein
MFFSVVKLHNVRHLQEKQNTLHKRDLRYIFVLYLEDSRAILYAIFRHFLIVFFIKFLDQLGNYELHKKDSTQILPKFDDMITQLIN